jgi:hypothetical protein
MDYIAILGYSAGVFGSIPMLPQIYINILIYILIYIYE